MKLPVYVIFSFCTLIISPHLSANSFELTVVDSDGRPLNNAVISQLYPEQATAPTEVAVMDQRDKSFDPHVLVVQQGSQVSFPNSDNIRHHVYSFSQPKKFEIKLYSGEPSSPVMFDNPGVVVLGCNIHDSMLGYIYVAPSSAYAITNEQGRMQLRLASEVSDDMQFQIWHPQLNAHNQPVNLSYREIKQKNFTVSLALTVDSARNIQPDKALSPLEKRFRELRQRQEQP